MKQLSVQEGFHPLTMTNLEFIQRGSGEGLIALAAALVPAWARRAVITGCALSEDAGAGTTTMADGWMLYEHPVHGRLLVRVPGQTVSVQGPQNMKMVFTRLPAAGYKASSLFKDGVARAVYLEDLLTLRVGGVLEPGELGFKLTEIEYRYTQDVPGTIGTWMPRPGQLLADYWDLTTGLGKLDWTGYAICDGRNGTPDMRGMTTLGFVPQTDSGELGVRLPGEYETLGQTVGIRAVRLELNELPPHSHNIKTRAAGTAPTGNPRFIVGDQSENSTDGNADRRLSNYGAVTDVSGGNAMHENRQPSRVLIFWQKL